MSNPPATLPTAPTMGNLQRVRYTHEDMIDTLITHPEIAQRELAARYGYTEGWVSNIMASDVFKARLAERRKELLDPALANTLREKFEALAHRSADRLIALLDKPEVADNTLLKAAELGAKVGGLMGTEGVGDPAGSRAVDHLGVLAQRLVDLRSGVYQQPKPGVVYEGHAEQVETR